jgi:uroporphyrinogen decarboxylase
MEPILVGAMINSMEVTMNKRDLVLSMLEDAKPHDYVPAAFFIHFDTAFHRGSAAITKHLEYFRYTGMDFVKIQYEEVFPYRPEIRSSKDWIKMPAYGVDFYANQLAVLKGLLQEAQKEALVIMTVYSPFMCAGNTVGREQVMKHIREDPLDFKKGMAIITNSLLLFVKECIKLGIDGFYASTQGGETHRFGGSALFDECIKPYDLAMMEEMNRSCIFNILHVCDYHGAYDSLAPFLDYPGQVVNCSPLLGKKRLTAEQLARMFNRPYMGGMDRHGVIAQGDSPEIARAAELVLRDAPSQFILGADCTLPNDVNWENIRVAIDTAHGHRSG